MTLTGFHEAHEADAETKKQYRAPPLTGRAGGGVHAPRFLAAPATPHRRSQPAARFIVSPSMNMLTMLNFSTSLRTGDPP